MSEALRKFIEDECIFRCPPGYYLKGIPDGKMYSWQFYLRRVLFDQTMMRHVANWLVENHNPDCQYAAMETAGPPMLTAMMQSSQKKIEGFAIRKDQKKYGLFNMVEGRFDPKKPVIILDDIANSKSTILRARTICEGLGLKVVGAATIVNKSRDDNTVEGLALKSMFSIDQFKLTWEEYYGTMNSKVIDSFINTYRGVLFKQTGPNTVVKL